MYPTLLDIAQEVGVSQPVVSKVLNGGKSIGANASDETRQKIIEAAERMGYRRHMGAVAMKKKRFNCIGLLMSSDSAAHYSPSIHMLRGISDELENQSMHLSITRMKDEALIDPLKMPRLLRELGIDGLLINYNHFCPEEIAPLIWRSRVPAIWINDIRETDAVLPDDALAGETAVAKLLEAGHRRIRYISTTSKDPTPHYSIAARESGYTSAMETAGLEPDVVSDADIDNWIQDFTDPQRKTEAPTALISYHQSTLTQIAIRLATHGLLIPRDLSVIGFADEPFSLDKPVSTLISPDHEVGKVAIEVLLKKFDEKKITVDAISIPYTWQAGETIAPPRS